MRLAAMLLVLVLWLGAATTAQGGTTTTASAAAPVKIVRCDAQFNYAQTGGSAANYVGYSDEYYPGTPYYWDDPYGLAYYQTPASSPSRLFIDFVNVSPKPMKVVVFGLVVADILIAEVRDQGTFTPQAGQAPIRHTPRRDAAR